MLRINRSTTHRLPAMWFKLSVRLQGGPERAMFGLDGSFGQLTAFLQGYWMADARLLDGWREWLVIQFDAGNNLGWQGLARRLASPEEHSPFLPLDDVQNRVASDRLFRLLGRFLTERESSGGTSAIKAAHQAWMERQSWYRSEGSA